MKKGDYIIILCSLLIALIPLGIRMFLGMPEQRQAVVTVLEEGRVIYRGPAETDHVVETAGGGNRIVIRNGDVYMEYADCRDQVCVKEGKAKPGKPLVCLPNHVIVTVTASDGEPDYDAISK
ncbi:MAG: NusG domain II-containing protein [Clostridiales bacterium]|nr:NusG domain II-containing protein [Clostridiales bacterium]